MSNIGLFKHNEESYRKINFAFKNGEKIVGIVHATGTGKTYNALQLAFDNKDKKILYLAPSNGIIEHVKKLINDNLNLDINKDFNHLNFRTYQSLLKLSKEEIEELNVDILVLDEFHHLGAPVWGAKVKNLIETHKNIKVFGMTAYTVRDRGTIYERDMANPDTEELFSNTIVSRYDLCDAIIDGVLPKPIYKSAYVNLIDTEKNLENKIHFLNISKQEYDELLKLLESVKKRIADAPSIKEVVKKNVKKDGKYIYFCPTHQELGTNDIKTIKSEALSWFKEYVKEEDIIIYETTSGMGELGKKNRESFYADKTLDGKNANGKLRVMFAINQYNEGVHAPNVDGVIMGRGTESDIVYFEQLGRALSVRGNTLEKYEEYNRLSKEELLKLCEEQDILLNADIKKEEIIEKLLSPVIIDLTNNYGFMKELENNLRYRIKNIYQKGGLKNHKLKISEVPFDIEIENHDIYEMLKYVSDRLIKTWEDVYQLAKNYYLKYNNLEIPINYKTINGYEYDENGYSLGKWIANQRYAHKNNELSDARYKLLSAINMRFQTNLRNINWEQNYELLKIYYSKYGNFKIPSKFKTLNGIDYDENGVLLRNWLNHQRYLLNKNELSSNRKELLELIGVFSEDKKYEIEWQKKYNLVKKYYLKYGNLEIPSNFRTLDGTTYDILGVDIRQWFDLQRFNYRNNLLSSKRILLLNEIGMNLKETLFELNWQRNYEFLQEYLKKYGNLEIPISFKTLNGKDYHEEGIFLGKWLAFQRQLYQNGKLNEERSSLLEKIGIRLNLDLRNLEWDNNYNLAKTYFQYYNHLEIPKTFKTKNGYMYDENGSLLGNWISIQRQAYQKGKLSNKRMTLLKEIGMRFDTNKYEVVWNRMYELAINYYSVHNNLNIPQIFKTKNGYEFDENGISLGTWLLTQRQLYKNNKLSIDKINKLNALKIIWNVRNNLGKLRKLCKQYNIIEFLTDDELKCMIFDEFKLKLDYLISKNIPLVNEGILHEIFFMNDLDIQDKYGNIEVQEEQFKR